MAAFDTKRRVSTVPTAVLVTFEKRHAGLARDIFCGFEQTIAAKVEQGPAAAEKRVELVAHAIGPVFRMCANDQLAIPSGNTVVVKINVGIDAGGGASKSTSSEIGGF